MTRKKKVQPRKARKAVTDLLAHNALLDAIRERPHLYRPSLWSRIKRWFA